MYMYLYIHSYITSHGIVLSNIRKHQTDRHRHCNRTNFQDTRRSVCAIKGVSHNSTIGGKADVWLWPLADAVEGGHGRGRHRGGTGESRRQRGLDSVWDSPPIVVACTRGITRSRLVVLSGTTRATGYVSNACFKVSFSKCSCCSEATSVTGYILLSICLLPLTLSYFLGE